MHLNDFADRNFFGIDFNPLSVAENTRLIRANVHKRCDGFSRLADSVILKNFADLIKQNNRYAFGEIAVLALGHLNDTERERAERSNRHKKVFVENFTVADIADRLPQNVVSGGKVNNAVKRKPYAVVYHDYFIRYKDSEETDEANARPYRFFYKIFIHKKSFP